MTRNENQRNIFFAAKKLKSRKMGIFVFAFRQGKRAGRLFYILIKS